MDGITVKRETPEASGVDESAATVVGAVAPPAAAAVPDAAVGAEPAADGNGEGQGPRSFPTVDPDAIRLAFETGRYPSPRRMGRAVYERDKALLQAE